MLKKLYFLSLETVHFIVSFSLYKLKTIYMCVCVFVLRCGFYGIELAGEIEWKGRGEILNESKEDAGGIRLLN